MAYGSTKGTRVKPGRKSVGTKVTKKRGVASRSGKSPKVTSGTKVGGRIGGGRLKASPMKPPSRVGGNGTKPKTLTKKKPVRKPARRRPAR